jgi:hypothetical protein
MAISTPIAGISIPDSAITREATEFVQDVSTQLLYDHSRRVFSGDRYWARSGAWRLTPSCCTSGRCSTTSD